MKTILTSTIVVFLFTALLSCKKEANEPKEKPLQSGGTEAFLKGESPLISDRASGYETGINFTSLVKGTIKSIKLHLPEKGNFLVTLWRTDDKSIVTNVALPNNDENSWTGNAIEPVSIEPNTLYTLSVNAHSFYYVNNTLQSLPFRKDAITIRYFSLGMGSQQSLPTFPIVTGAAGFIDFTFQPSE